MDSQLEYFWTNLWPHNDYRRSISLPCGHQFCHENWKLLPGLQRTGLRKWIWDQLMFMTGDESKTQDFEHRWPAGPVCCLPPGRDKLRWVDPRVAFLYMISLWFRDALPLGSLTIWGLWRMRIQQLCTGFIAWGAFWAIFWPSLPPPPRQPGKIFWSKMVCTSVLHTVLQVLHSSQLQLWLFQATFSIGQFFKTLVVKVPFQPKFDIQD